MGCDLPMHYGGILTAPGGGMRPSRALTRSMRLYDESYRALRAGAPASLIRGLAAPPADELSRQRS
jgi:hypothetical protein